MKRSGQLGLVEVLLSAGMRTADPALRSWMSERVRATVEERERCQAAVELRCVRCGRVQRRRLRCGPDCAACRNKGGRQARVAARIASTMPHVATRHMVVTFSPRVTQALSGGRLRAVEIQRIFERVMFGAIAARVRARGRRAKLGFGAVSIVHPFGNDLRLAPHLHALVLDGAFVRRGDSVSFQALERGFTPDEIAEIAAEIARRLEDATRLVPTTSTAVTELLASAQTPPAPGLSARDPPGPDKGWGDRAGTGRPPRELGRSQGVEVYCSRRIPAGDHHGRRRVLEYLGRSPLDPTRLELQPDGQVRVQLNRPGTRGAKAVELGATELARRVAALGSVAQPGAIRQHGLMVRRTAKRWGLCGRQLELPALTSAPLASAPLASAPLASAPKEGRSENGQRDSSGPSSPEPRCRHCGGPLATTGVEELA